MPSTGASFDVRSSLIESSRQSNKTDMRKVLTGGGAKGGDVAREGMSKAENVRSAVRSAAKEKALKRIANEDETPGEKDFKAKMANIALKRERAHKAMLDRFVSEEGRGGRISTTI